MRVLPFFVMKSLVTTSSSHMSTAAQIIPVVAFVNVIDLPVQKHLLELFPKVVS